LLKSEDPGTIDGVVRYLAGGEASREMPQDWRGQKYVLEAVAPTFGANACTQLVETLLMLLKQPGSRILNRSQAVYVAVEYRYDILAGIRYAADAVGRNDRAKDRALPSWWDDVASEALTDVDLRAAGYSEFAPYFSLRGASAAGSCLLLKSLGFTIECPIAASSLADARDRNSIRHALAASRKGRLLVTDNVDVSRSAADLIALAAAVRASISGRKGGVSPLDWWPAASALLFPVLVSRSAPLRFDACRAFVAMGFSLNCARLLSSPMGWEEEQMRLRQALERPPRRHHG
jgi:hypothetical protein